MDKSSLADFRALCEGHGPTRLLELPVLAHKANVGRVLAKMECDRPLGNFKALGGTVAALRALLRATGAATLEEHKSSLLRRELPRLICASDGNHGLSVAAAAARVGAKATIYLPMGANPLRADRIAAIGGKIRWISGTYDDAVDAAAAAAARGEGLLIPDTSADPDDPVVKDVMAGYEVLTQELVAQLRDQIQDQPTHVFVQAGVGGLAAAMAEGLRELMRKPPGKILVIEPESAACVAQALAAGRPVSIPGTLRTSAEMLSCGLVSAPALEILKRHSVRSVVVDEDQLQAAPGVLLEAGGPETTPSGAAGLAGFWHIATSADLRVEHQLSPDSNVLFVVTEGVVPR